MPLEHLLRVIQGIAPQLFPVDEFVEAGRKPFSVRSRGPDGTRAASPVGGAGPVKAFGFGVSGR